RPKRSARLIARPASDQLATGGDRPFDLHVLPADAVDLVMHVDADAAMVGDDVDHLADLRPLLGAGEIEDAMLLRQVGDDGAGILDDPPEVLDVILLAGDRLRAGIDDGAVAGWRRDDGGADRERALVPRRIAGTDHHHV